MLAVRDSLPILAALALSASVAAPAFAAPGHGDDVFGVGTEKGEFSASVRHDTLHGDSNAGAGLIVLGTGYGVSERLTLGVTADLVREPQGHYEYAAAGIEAYYELGRAGGVDIGLYATYQAVRGDSDGLEARLLLERKSGPLDVRFNLLAIREARRRAPVDFAYAASADLAIAKAMTIGVEAFGELGHGADHPGFDEHFLGPCAKFLIEGKGPALDIQLAYLFALGGHHDAADGQLRLMVGIAFPLGRQGN